MSNTVYARWVREQGQLELRTYQPSTGLKPRTDPFEYQLLGLVLGSESPLDAMRSVEAQFRERNPGTVLRVSGDAPQIVRGPHAND